MKIHFTRGLSGSGKTYQAKSIQAETGAAIVSMDDVRASLGLPYSKENEKLALTIHHNTVIESLRAGKDVIISNLHLHDKWPREISVLVWEQGFDVQYELIDLVDVPLGTCRARNDARIAEGKPGVPDEVILKQAKQLAREKQKGLWAIEDLKLPEIVPYVPDDTKPKALLVDIDGTIARAEGRGPFDFDRLHEDKANVDVLRVVSAMSAAGYRIIIVTGRDLEYRETTIAWLKQHGIGYDAIFTRTDGNGPNKKRDSLVKLEIFNQYIRPVYNCIGCLDDRDRVVNMYRALGLRVYQCQPGNF